MINPRSKIRHIQLNNIILCRTIVFCVAAIFFCTQFTKTVQAQISQQSNLNKTSSIDKQTNSRTVTADIDDFLTATGVSGGVLITKNGEVIFRRGYGWADENRKIPITSKTVFDIGSITKQFTGAAILKLEEQGKLKVTDSITKFFKNVPVDKREITLHQLLTHTAGFEQDVIEFGEFPSREESVSRTLDSKLKLKPGEKYAYSNAGYVLLAAIIEIASGMSYEGYLHENLWKPARMLKTGNLIPRFLCDELARGYDLAGDLGFSQDKWWAADGPSWGGRGAGYVLSTLEDLYLWHLALDGEKILSEESKRKFFAPHVPEDEAGASHYGYGWAIFKTSRDTRLIAHDGSNGIFFADFHRYVDEDVVIIYFNSERDTVSRQVFNSVPRLFFGDEMPNFPRPEIKLSQIELSKYTGTYELPSSEKFTLDINNNRLSVKTISPGIGKLLTTFPEIKDAERLQNLQFRTAKVIKNIAKEDFEPIRELIYFEGAFEEEKAYWKRTFTEWTQRFGAFKTSEIVGSVSDKEFLVTYVLLRFEHGATLTQFRQNTQKRFFIGTSAFILPGYYRLIPQSKTKFAVFNPVLQTTTPISFSFDRKNVVTGLTIQKKNEEIYARKVLP